MASWRYNPRTKKFFLVYISHLETHYDQLCSSSNSTTPIIVKGCGMSHLCLNLPKHQLKLNIASVSQLTRHLSAYLQDFKLCIFFKDNWVPPRSEQMKWYLSILPWNATFLAREWESCCHYKTCHFLAPYLVLP